MTLFKSTNVYDEFCHKVKYFLKSTNFFLLFLCFMLGWVIYLPLSQSVMSGSTHSLSSSQLLHFSSSCLVSYMLHICVSDCSFFPFILFSFLCSLTIFLVLTLLLFLTPLIDSFLIY